MKTIVIIPAYEPEEKLIPLTQQLIAKLTAGGVGVIVSTHDLSLARDVCSQACVLASRLVALGPTDEVLVPEVLARAYGSSADEAIAALS